MAYKDVMEVLKSSDSDLLNMWKMDTLSQTAAQKTAFDVGKLQLESQIGLLEKNYDSSDAAVAAMEKNIIEGGDFDISDSQGPNYRMYKDAWNRRASAFTDYANVVNLPVYASENDIISLVDNIFETTVADVKNPRSKLKWGDKEGGWAQLVTKLSPGANLDLVEIVWNDRYGKLKGGVGTDEDLASVFTSKTPALGTGEEGLPAGMKDRWDIFTPQEMGKLPWWLEEGAYWWLDQTKKAQSRTSALGQAIRDRVLETSGERESRLGGRTSASLSQYEEAAQRRDQSLLSAKTGILSSMMPTAQASGGPSPQDRTGQAAVIARNAAKEVTPLMGQEGLINGFFAKQKTDGGLKITKRAMDFLERFAQMIIDEGPEDAFRLMSAEFQQLGKSDRQQIEEHLQKQQV